MIIWMLVFNQILKIANPIGLYFTLNNGTELEEFQIKNQSRFYNQSWVNLYIERDKKGCLYQEVNHWTSCGS
jgi:hypothetical protein